MTAHMFGGGFFDGGWGAPWGLVMGFAMMLLWIGFWIVVVMLIVRLIRRGAGPRTSSAVSVLEERYARGEITRDEFNERRVVLLGGEPPPAV